MPTAQHSKEAPYPVSTASAASSFLPTFQASYKSHRTSSQIPSLMGGVGGEDQMTAQKPCHFTHLEKPSRSPKATRDWLCGRQFFHEQGVGMVSG